MSRTPTSWFERIRALPVSLRLVGTAALLSVASAGLLGGALSGAQFQLLLLATILVGTLLLGLTAGLAGATLGFGLMLWRAMEPATAGGSWALSFQAAFDAFLWFAVAKLAVALVAAPQGLVGRLSTAARRAEAEARRRELLLDEMSHRIGNSLHLLVNMLQMQATADPRAADALRSAARRVLVLGRVHGRLSRGTEPEAVVDSRLFLEGLVADLRAGVDGVRPVALTIAAEAHALPLAQAGDVGLIVNELVTNALKHAFPEGKEGVVRVTFRRDGGMYELAVADNGVGTAALERPGRGGGGLGSRILRSLAAQLGGRLEVARGEVGGTLCLLRFPVPEPGPRQASENAEIEEQATEAWRQDAEPEHRLRRGRG